MVSLKKLPILLILALLCFLLTHHLSPLYTANTNIAIVETTPTITSTPSPSPTLIPTPSLTPIPTPNPTATPTPTFGPAPEDFTAIDYTGSSLVCLTFDDGGNSKSIIRILDCLKKNDVQCTFFVIGEYLKKYPDLWKRAILEGHEIAYHTTDHKRITTKTTEEIIQDVSDWNDIAHEVLGNDYEIPKLARLPLDVGNKNPKVLSVFHFLGYQVIRWSADTLDIMKKTTEDQFIDQVPKYVIRKAKNQKGLIVLQHFCYWDSKTLPYFIETLKKDYSLVTISFAMKVLDRKEELANLPYSSPQ